MTKMIAPDKQIVILASASPRRSVLLEQLGLVPDKIIPADIDEAPHKGELPAPYAKRMAFEKTAAIAERYPEAFVIGADTVVACGRRILPKAESEAQARSCLSLLMGRSHRVYGGIALAIPKSGSVLAHIKVKTNYSKVTFRRLDEVEMQDYINQGDWDGKAGGYAIQGAAARYITSISGSYSQIMGLDIYEMYHLLKGAGFRPETACP